MSCWCAIRFFFVCEHDDSSSTAFTAWVSQRNFKFIGKLNQDSFSKLYQSFHCADISHFTCVQSTHVHLLSAAQRQAVCPVDFAGTGKGRAWWIKLPCVKSNVGAGVWRITCLW